ncbi:MAG: FAD-dependent oxidoreductase [Kiritimatiellae bacterium]|nr:FAD-dependent oxidoreductase [Kiritimatiellia bacterium]
MMKKLLGCILFGVLCCGANADSIVEPGRTLPLVQDVDVVVVGGSSGAVAAACRAKAAGARVFLIAPRPYLGEDMAGKLRIHLDPNDDTRSPLVREMFTESSRPADSLPFIYTASRKAENAHADPDLRRLNDGNYLLAPKDSVQYAGDVTLSLNLGKTCAITKVVIASFMRDHPERGFKTESVTIRGRADGKDWSAPVTGKEWRVVEGGDESHLMELPFRGKYRELEIIAKQAVGVSRQLLGEIFIYSDEKPSVTVSDRTTPLKVKKTLDEALLKAQIPFLTGAMVTETVTDENGKLAGVIMANRSGRQVVRAKVVIDATERAHVARLAGSPITPFPAGNYTFTRMVLSGEMPKAEGMKVREILGVYPARNQMGHQFSGVITGKMFSCSITLPMKDGSARSFAEAEQRTRDATFTRQQLTGSDTTIFTPPDHIRAAASSSASWQGADSFDLKSLQPTGYPNLFVLGALADVPRETATELMRPGNYMAVGSRVGEAAAKLAATLPAVGKVSLQASTQVAAAGTKVGETSGSLPGYLTNTKGSVVVGNRELPVLASCDVFVAGAGTGGAPAGIAAGRHGKKVIICDYLYSMGGVQTDGLIGIYWFGNRVGFTKEIDAGEKETGAVLEQGRIEWYRKQYREYGGEVWYGTLVSGVVIENGALTGVVVIAPDGERGVIRCKVAIDATGNAVLPALAGEPTEFVNAEEISVQGAGMTPRTLGARYTNTDIGFVDDSDAADLCYFALRSRESMRDGIWDQAQVVNTRERRRMHGAYYVTPMDIMNHRTYPDTVSQPYSNFDTHGQTVHPLFFIDDPGHNGIAVNVPYRCFLPQKLDGLLVIGLGMSAHRDAMPVLRMQPDVQNQGYAAGTAAAMAIDAGVTVRNVNVKALQRHLVDKGILKPEVLTMKDSFPISDEKMRKAVRDMPNNYIGLHVVMTDPARAIPLLKRAYASATVETNRLIYAHVLAMMGEKDGERDLIRKLETTQWDPGWNYRGMGQFNRSISWVDSYIIALGCCRSVKAVPAILEKVKILGQDNQYSHFRAVALALESIGDKTAAATLAELLQKPGIGGHALKMTKDIPVIPGYANKAGDKERSDCLRELCVARALFRLGDQDGIARKTLEAYAADPRRIYANHSRMVLGE